MFIVGGPLSERPLPVTVHTLVASIHEATAVCPGTTLPKQIESGSAVGVRRGICAKPMEESVASSGAGFLLFGPPVLHSNEGQTG